MSAHQFLQELNSLGIRVKSVGENLSVAAPKGAVTEYILKRLATMKRELLVICPPEIPALPIDTVYSFLSDCIETTPSEGWNFPDRPKYTVRELALYAVFCE